MGFNIIPIVSRTIRSEHTVDALRNTFAVVLPIAVFLQLGWPTTAIGIGIGALMICMTDLPGNRGDKFRTAWISVLIFTAIAILTAATTAFTGVMIAFVVLITFLLTMLGAFGQRMGAIGLMGIVLATFTIGLKPKDPLLYGNYILIGGAWYYLISLLQIYLFPYRSLTRAINHTLRDTAALIRLRATGYNPSVDLAGFNQRNIRLHLKLASQHELIRQLLLSDKRAMRDLDVKIRLFLEQSINLIDLYEQVSAVHYDYPFLRKKLADADVLPLIEQSASLLATQLVRPTDQQAKADFNNIYSVLQSKLAFLSVEQTALLEQILANISEINTLIAAIHQPMAAAKIEENTVRYRDFLTTAPAPRAAIQHHFSISSPIFRFSLRLATLCLVALLLITWLSGQHYTYWLLLTIVIVSRPSYGQTIRRNIERLIGTILGLLLGWLAISFVASPLILVISVLGLFGFFAFNRVFYAASVICITVAVVICLNAYDGNLWQIVTERVAFTIAGVLLCLGATFVFPIWNALRLSDLVAKVFEANQLYFQSVVQAVPTDLESLHQTKLARKYSHQQLSALSEAMQATRTEPLGKRLNWPLMKRLQLLSFQFNVLTATFSGAQKQGREFLSQAEIAVIEHQLQQCAINVKTLDIYEEKSLPVWGDQPMNLLEVSSHLAELVS